MSDQSLRFDPPERCTIADLRVGDYVTRVDRTVIRPERRVQTLQRPMVWDGHRVGLWGVGLANGEAIAVGGDGDLIGCERLSASEAARRDKMASAGTLRADGTIGSSGRLIV